MMEGVMLGCGAGLGVAAVLLAACVLIALWGR